MWSVHKIHIFINKFNQRMRRRWKKNIHHCIAFCVFVCEKQKQIIYIEMKARKNRRVVGKLKRNRFLVERIENK